MDRRQLIRRLVLLGAAALGPGSSPRARSQPPIPPLPTFTDRTLGGKQFWADEFFFHHWRIQRNVLTGHCRLLDEDDVRYASGSFAACRERLEEIRRRERLGPMQGPGVVLLHGLGRTRSAMKGLARLLGDEGKFSTFNVGYPTLQGGIGDHAQTLARVLASLDGISTIHFVAHSLWNLVVRRWMFDVQQRATPPIERGRLGRMVMLAPPNHRPEIAGRLAAWTGVDAVAGDAFRQLASDWDSIAPTLAIPSLPFGILAGGRGDERGYNPLVAGDDDLIVSVASTRLAGARDFRRLPVIHTLIMDHPEAQPMTLEFLRHGYFESEAKRQPITHADSPSK